MWRFFKRYAASYLRRHASEQPCFETAETYDRHLNLYGCLEDCGYICC